MRVQKVTIVTPCRNAEHLVAQTVESIWSQTALASGRLEIEHLVFDGASRDHTVDVARRASAGRATIVSEPDGGMYDALAKGLRRATGDVVAYLNAGDMYHRTALDVVADLFETQPVEWLTGLSVRYNPRGQVFEVTLPYRFRRELIRRGMYGGRRILPFVQQESTFWSRGLHEAVDLERLARCRYAGDFFLWKCFASRADLAIVSSFLGGFLYHPGQASEDLAAYREEVRSLAEAPSAADWIVAAVDRALWYAPPEVKKALNPERLYRCRRGDDRWG